MLRRPRGVITVPNVDLDNFKDLICQLIETLTCRPREFVPSETIPVSGYSPLRVGYPQPSGRIIGCRLTTVGVQTLRISSWTPWLIVALLAGGTAGWQIDRSPQPEQSRSSDNPRQSRAKMSTRVVHYVTPRQLIASNAMTDQNLADLEATGHDGVRRSWAELSGGEPVVLVFVKQGCPCNVEFDPYFRRVERLYRGASGSRP